MKLLLTVVLCMLFVNVVSGSKSNRQRSLVYRGQTGSLTDQFLELKKMYLDAEAQHRQLVLVQSKDEVSGLSSYNLCDIFELPESVSCEKHMKMKCQNETAPVGVESKKQKQKKKVSFHCDPVQTAVSVQHISNSIDLLPAVFPAKLLPKRMEEVEYMQAMLGLVSKQSKMSPYTAVYWGQAPYYLGKDIGPCVYSADGPQEGNDACKQLHAALAQLKAVSEPYCSNAALQTALDNKDSKQEKKKSESSTAAGVHAKGPGLCYIAGATQATAVEAKLMLAYGLQSFRGAWMQHQEGAQLVHINPVSVEIMEFGLMLGANKFVTLIAEQLSTISTAGSPDAPATAGAGDRGNAVALKQAAEIVLLTSFLEHERAREGRSYCTSHKDGVIPLAAEGVTDVSFCGRLKSSNYLYKATTDHSTDDGPFENPALNKIVVKLALTLLAVFSSRVLQLGLGFITVVLIIGLFRLCYTRWKRVSTKTY